MVHEDSSKLLARFPSAKVMVVGDIYLDEMVYGVVTEVSLEAPILVYEVHERRYNPGAAGNAACNVASLGAKAYMVGVVGDDINAGIVRHEFEVRNVDISHLVVDPKRPTNTYGKLRAGGHNIPTQEILRTDTPKPVMIAGEVEAQVIAQIKALAPEVDAILIGDQVSATISEQVLATIVACAKEHTLIAVADSRQRAGIFKGIDMVVPNDAEAGLAAGIEVVDEVSLHAAGKALLKTAKQALITRGPHGITVFSGDGSIDDVPIAPVRVVDVTGAGDTVAAAVVITLCAGGTALDAAVLGNAAAGVAVAQEGVVTVNLEELRATVLGEAGPAKVKTLEQLKPVIARLKQQGKRVVWTNGCFDLLHVGHITYLQRARQQGDVLVVGLNNDASVRENKGPERPVVNEKDRAVVLSALEAVDFVIVFGDKTPMPLLEALEPHVYAKGGDYSIDTIVQAERRLVEGYGGEIAIIAGVAGQSTSELIDRVQQDK